MRTEMNERKNNSKEKRTENTIQIKPTLSFISILRTIRKIKYFLISKQKTNIFISEKFIFSMKKKLTIFICTIFLRK